MIKISYYKTSNDRLSKAFCMLAEKCYHNNIKLFVFTNNEKSTREFDTVLWTYSKKQFIPHGTIHDLSPEKQPILLGEMFKNLNKSSGMIIINAEETQLLDFLASVGKVDRLFFIYSQDAIIPASRLMELTSKSALGEFEFESYMQEANGSWKKQGEIQIKEDGQ